MEISGHVPPSRSVNAGGSSRPPAAAKRFEVTAGPVVPTTPEAGAPAEPAEPGPVKAAGVSHRSDGAALRQWINHPELRDDLPLPELTGEHHGNGFQKAVAAYQTATAIVPPAESPTDPVVDTPPATDAIVDTPPATDPGPILDVEPVSQTDPFFDPAVLPEADTSVDG